MNEIEVDSKGEQYLSRLLNGREDSRSAKEKLRTLFQYTGYNGDNWLA